MEFLKAASSAAHVYGRKVVSAGSFVHFGQAYRSTTESLERDANRLFAAGVNQIVYHGFPYVYFNDTDFTKSYALGPGSFERWEPTTGQVTAYAQSRIELAPGKAALLLRK